MCAQPLHFGLTLISILRLGITDETRDRLYRCPAPLLQLFPVALV